MLRLLLLVTLLGRLDAWFAPGQWTKSNHSQSLCQQWKKSPVPWLALGFVNNGSFLLVGRNLTGLRVDGADRFRVDKNKATVNFYQARFVILLKRRQEDASLSDLAHSFIVQTVKQSFVTSIVERGNLDVALIFPLDGQTKMWNASITANMKLAGKVLFSGPKVGQFAVLNGTDLLAGHYDGQEIEEKMGQFAKDENIPVQIQFNITTSNNLGKIQATSSIDGGFIADGVLFAIDNTAKKVLLYKLEPDAKTAAEPFLKMDFGKFVVCECCGSYAFDILLGLCIVIVIVIIGTFITVIRSNRRRRQLTRAKSKSNAKLKGASSGSSKEKMLASVKSRAGKATSTTSITTTTDSDTTPDTSQQQQASKSKK